MFEKKEDIDLIFRNGPYFMGPRGMYLNKWDLSFDVEKDIPSKVPVWVKLPHLLLHCWNDEVLKTIEKSLGKYIDKSYSNPPMFSCTRICVEADLEKGLLKAINLNMEGWKHLQTIDYEKIPFKCKVCHKYGHFEKSYKKKTWVEEWEITIEEWNEVNQRKGKKAMNSQVNSLAKKKKNSFQALASTLES